MEKHEVIEKIEVVRQKMQNLGDLLKSKQKSREDVIEEYRKLRKEESELIEELQLAIASEDTIEGRILKVLYDFNHSPESIDSGIKDNWELVLRNDLVVIKDKYDQYIVYWQKIEGKWNPIHRNAREIIFLPDKKYIRKVRKIVSDYIKTI